MNERIRELIRLADVHILPDDSEYGHCIIGLEKFAELIVRECAGLCSTHEMADEPFGEKSYRKGRHFDVMIRQHFGVE